MVARDRATAPVRAVAVKGKDLDLVRGRRRPELITEAAGAGEIRAGGGGVSVGGAVWHRLCSSFYCQPFRRAIECLPAAERAH